jgi:hypothetical protein
MSFALVFNEKNTKNFRCLTGALSELNENLYAGVNRDIAVLECIKSRYPFPMNFASPESEKVYSKRRLKPCKFHIH